VDEALSGKSGFSHASFETENIQILNVSACQLLAVWGPR